MPPIESSVSTAFVNTPINCSVRSFWVRFFSSAGPPPPGEWPSFPLFFLLEPPLPVDKRRAFFPLFPRRSPFLPPSFLLSAERSPNASRSSLRCFQSILPGVYLSEEEEEEEEEDEEEDEEEEEEEK